MAEADAGSRPPSGPQPTREELEAGRREVIERWGPWQHHNIHLGHGVYTMGADVAGQQARLPQVVQMATDLLSVPVEGARVLDLAAHEGQFGIELALRGASVIAVEIREDHVEKARFARDALGLGDMEVRRGDVRSVTRDAYGQFDLVLCLGILYHLDADSAFELTERIAALCRPGATAIIDTVVGLKASESFTRHGFTYRGRSVWEHDPAATHDERMRAHGASFDNPRSVWFTRPSLFNLLRRCGFTSVLEARVPRSQYGARDRAILAAVRGTPSTRMQSAPQLETPGDPDWPESARLGVRVGQTRLWRVRHLAARLLPAPLRRAYRSRRG